MPEGRLGRSVGGTGAPVPVGSPGSSVGRPVGKPGAPVAGSVAVGVSLGSSRLKDGSAGLSSWRYFTSRRLMTGAALGASS